MKYYLGIDGGGTKTSIVLTDKDLEIYDQDSSGPSHYLNEGKEKSAHVITELIWEVMRNSDVRSSDVSFLGIGVAGAGREGDRKELKEEIELLLKDKGVFINTIVVETDARASLMGAHSGKPGCILIAGTGSVLYGQTEDGKFFRCGGYGRIIGDEGSGFSIGKTALNYLAREMDGRGKASLLTEMLVTAYNLNNPDDLINGVYKFELDVPSAAEIVIKAAAENDNRAVDILKNESDELIRHLEAAAPNFKNKSFMLTLAGSLLSNENIYSAIVKEKIKKKFPEITIKEADYSPEIGAILLSGIRI